jgi:HSP20 family molecular chaperone IbpA
MSAKWRRNKKRSNWSKVFKATKKVENRKALRTFKIKNCETKKHGHPNRFRLVKIRRAKNLKEPEPLVDVLQEKDEVVVIAEVAGFKRENLKIQVNQHLVLSAEALDRKYYKSLNLPIGVIPDKIHTAYKNGVLEIRLKKIIEEKTVDKVAN